MKIIIAILIIFTQSIIFSQWESNTGITTELKSSSNGWPGSYYTKGWACGVNGVVIRTGNSQYDPWINVSGNGIPSNVTLDNICGYDNQSALVCGHLNGNTWMWKTTNNGANWFQVFTQPNGMFNAVHMKNSLQGFLTGNPVNGRWSLWKTTNGGLNWDSAGLNLPQSGSETGWPNSLCIGKYSDSNRVWFGTTNNRIYYSSNYGLNWSAQIINNDQIIYTVSYGYSMGLPVNTVFAGGSNNLYRSTNYGNNWSQDTVGGNGIISGVSFLAFHVILARSNKIYSLNYTGYGWSASYTAPNGTYNFTGNKGNGGNFIDQYAVRTSGGLTFFSEGEGIKKISNNIPISFSLSQNYPNPFNPSTKISFSVPINKGGDRGLSVNLKIYDILGREAAMLVNENLRSGSYKVFWDASNYPSGTYFYKLTAGDFTETKKMILLK